MILEKNTRFGGENSKYAIGFSCSYHLHIQKRICRDSLVKSVEFSMVWFDQIQLIQKSPLQSNKAEIRFTVAIFAKKEAL